MDKLELVYDNAEDVPEGFGELYTETDGKFALTEINGMKTTADVDRLQESLHKERKLHKEVKTKLHGFGDLEADAVRTSLNELEELKLQVDGSDDKFEERVAARMISVTAPLERKLATIATERDTAIGEVGVFQKKEKNRNISDEIRAAGSKLKMVPAAIDDAITLGRNVMDVDEEGRIAVRADSGFDEGADPTSWIEGLRESKPHWWPASEGSGARGGNSGSGVGSNPFTSSNWNMTEQGKLHKENPERAARMAKMAGTTVGGMKPPEKS